MDSSMDNHIQYIRGLPLPNVPWFTKKNVEDAMDYKPEDSDIVIASYPKTGSTWMQYIVLQIISQGEKFPSIDNMVNKEVPFVEITGTKVLESISKPRIYKHHLPYNRVQKNDHAKCIYIYRDPADTIVSHYFFLKELIPEMDLNFDQMFNNFFSEEVAFGSYFEHVLSFYSCRQKENLLMVSYEKLLSNIKEEILRIAKFLGEEYYKNLQRNEAVLEKIIKHTNFDYMKKNLYMTHPNKYDDKDGKNVINFFRKGIAGDGKNKLTDDQKQLLRNIVETTMRGTEIAEEWLIN